MYGTTLRNQFDLTCTTVFGGQGRANGEMIDPAGLFIDSGGNIINADSRNDRIQVKNPLFLFKIKSIYFLLSLIVIFIRWTI
jgi:hypothetical protein